MARKRPHEEHENHERWLVSYADFITLLFAFFVVMYAISSVNEGKYRVLSEALVAAFRAPTKSLDPIQFGSMVRSPHTPDPAIVKAPKTFIPAPIRIAKPPLDLLLRRQTQAAHSGPRGMKCTAEMQEMARELGQALAYLIEQDLVAV
jgi:chemotaxis protein MotB